MFNWLIFFFSLIAAFIEYGFGARYYVVPLILVIVTRTIYIIAFILRYAKIDDLKQLGDDTRAKNESSQDHKNKETTRTSATKKELELKRNDFIYFALSNWLTIFFSVFVPYVSAFFSTYSLLMAGGYFIAISDFLKGKAKTAVEILGDSFYFLGPIAVGTVLSITDDISNLISVSLALSIYITYGHKVVKRTKSTFIHRYRHKKLRTLKRGVKIGLLVLVITMPIFLVAGTVQTGTRRKQTFMVEMRDGTELATSIYFVPGYMDNSLPVVLTRTPYGKDLLEENALGVYTKVYGSQKYHVAIQDIRGCYDSEGKDQNNLIMTKSYTDGVDTIQWLKNQSWCNGKVVSTGISAGAINQYYFGGMDPDGLEAQSIWFGTPDMIQDAILEGAFHKRLVENWIKTVAPQNWREQLDYIYYYLNNPDTFDSELAPRTVSLSHAPSIYENVSFPALHVGGWYDHFLRGTIRGFMGYDDLGKEAAQGKQKMIIGPWIHGMVFKQQQGELTYPFNSIGIVKILEWETEIYDFVLNGKGNEEEIFGDNRVMYYLMGDVEDPLVDANKWKYAPDWPLDFSWNEWYFGQDQNGNMKVMDDSNDLENKNMSYLYDPRDPLPNRGGNNDPSRGSLAGPMDQLPVEKGRSDVLFFESEVLDKPYTIEGNLKAKLFVKSNCTDTDFMIKLTDVYPDGRRMLINDAGLTTRYHVNKTSINYITPGEEYEMEIDMAAIAYQFNKGHKIGISITSSNYDRFQLNANTGEEFPNSYVGSKIANNTIITGPNKSRIYLPELNN